MVCLQCSFSTKNPKFCSLSCAAKYNNNNNLPKRKKTKRCSSCNELILSSRTYCEECWNPNARSSTKIKRWLNEEWPGGTIYGLSDTVRNYLIHMSGKACQKCGFDKVHPQDNRPILEINHIDGNGINHSPENLEVLCPNCHALTDTYRGRNIGNGRPVSYTRKIMSQ